MLDTPFFGVHPCRTAELMALMLPAGASGQPPGAPPAGVDTQVSSRQLRYMLAWFSVIGEAVGLRLPPDVCAAGIDVYPASNGPVS